MNKKVKLVLSGSGTRYPAQIGAVIRLAEEGFEFTEVCGTSGGSIVAAGLASGYRPDQSLISLTKDLLPAKNKLIDLSLWSLFLKWGLIKGDKIERLIAERTVERFRDTVIPLHVVTTNIERKATRVFSTASDPDFKISTAVRASISIPGAFAPIKIDNELYVDGGVTANFLIDHFGNEADDVIGLYFEDSGTTDSWQNRERIDIKNAKDFVMANVDSMIESKTKEHIEDALYAKSIPLFTRHHSFNFYMNDDDVDEMVDDGYNSVDLWLKENKTSL